MENTRRRRSGGLRNIITAVFAVAFVASIVSTITAFAAANLFKIQNAELSELSTTAEGSISSFDEENIVSSVTFHKLNDSAKYTITLKNTDTKDHIIESITDDNINPYISYEYDQHMGKQIDAGSDFVFVVTAKYSTAITDIDQRAQVSNVKFFIHFTDIEEEILIVPNTGVSSNSGNFIRFSVISLVISAAGLTVAGIFALKKHKKASKYIIAGIITVAAITTTATVKAVTVEINSFTISTDITLKDKLVVTYTDKNGDEQELIVNYGEPANIPNQNKDGYTLTGWEDEQGNPVDPTQPITEDIKIHPIYRTHTYTIKFNGNGANGEMADLAITYDETKTLPTNAFDFPGRTYTGWDTEANGSGVHYNNESEVKNLTAEDNGIVTLYAQWSINPFRIDYDGNGATSGEMATTNCEYDGECVLRENAFKKTGYHFVGWKYSDNDYADKANVKNIVESGTITMVAQWAINHYTIVFDINTDDSNASGDMADMANLEYGQDYTLTANAFTRTGYNFGGWNTEIDGRNFGLTDAQEFHNLTTTDNAVITLYAQWNPIHYTIAFHQNSDGVTGNMSSQVFTYDEAKNLTQNAFIKNHYKFMGWTTVANGTGAKYDDQASIINLASVDGTTIDLYAQWKERTAMLDTGSNVNAILKSVNADTTAFEHYSGTPDFSQIDGEQDIALTTSNFPVYVWTANNKTYWWSEAEDVYMNQTSSQMFADLNSVESIDLRSLNTSNVQIMGSMFQNDYALTSINVSEIDTRNVTSVAGMFIRCTSLATLDFSKFDTSKVENMQSMFKETAFTELDLSDWNTSSLTNAITVFPAMPNLEKLDLSGWDFSKLNHAFSRVIAEHSQPGKYPAATVSKPKTIILDDAIFPTDMSNAFMNNSYGIMSRLEGISLDNVDTTRVNNMSGMFQGATSLTSLDLTGFDFGNVRNMSKMFYKASTLETITFANDIDTGSATNMASMFNEATSLSNVDVSHFNTEKVENMNGMFRFTPNLTNVDVSNFSTDSLKGSLESLFSYNGAAVLDLSGWDTSRVTIMRNLFLRNTAVTTIYASDSFVVSQVATEGTDDDGAFQNMSANLVGGAGTIFSGLTPTNLTYARIDDPDNGEPGFFTIKGARYIRYNGNGADNATPYGTMTSGYLKASDSLKKNAFTRSGYVFTGWKDADGNEYTDEQVMADLTESKTPLELYAQWIEATSVLQPGSSVNTILKSINPDAVAFAHYNGIPDFDAIGDERVISLSNAVVPTYAWSNDDTIYWWSEAETVYLNENSGSFFKNLSKLTTVEQTTLDTSKVKNMDYMFQYSGLVDFTFEMDTSNVISMDAIFANCSKLERLDLSHIDTSKVTNMHGLVADAQKLTYLNLDNFSTASATNLESMFSTVKLMTTLDLTSFDTRNVTNMAWMISYITNLQTIYATDLFVPANNISMPNTLVGGAGSRSLGTSSVYARIDDPDNGNPGYFTMKGARYIRYHDNDGDDTNDETNYTLMTSEYLKAGDSLKKNAFTRNGYVFTGWKDADNNEYTDEQVMADLAESKTPLELYAQWDAAPYTITFNANGGEVLQSTKTVTYLQPYGELPTPVKYDYANSILGGKYSFKEWNTKADGSGDTITSSSIYENTDDTTLYAIWNGQFTVTVYNGESETPTTASYGTDNIVYLNAQDVAGKQFLYWEVDGAKKAYNKNYSMRMFQGKDLTIRAIYGSESDLESQQPGTYISDIYRQYSENRVVVRSYSYVPDGYEIVKAGVVATLDADIANGTFDDQTATYPRAASVNGNSDNYYYTWSKSNVTPEDTVYVKAYLIYKDVDGVEHTVYGDLVTATLAE